MKISRRQFVKGGVGRVHDDVRRAGVPERSRARAGRIGPEPRRPVSERRQRRAQHARALQRSVLLPAAGRSIAVPAGKRAADRHRFVRRRARAASATHRPPADLQRGRAGADSAHRLRQSEPLALPGHRHLVDRRTRRTRPGSAGSGATSTRCRRRSIRSSAGTRRAICRACCRPGHVAVPAIPNPLQYSFNSPNTGDRGAGRAGRGDPHQLARAGRSAGSSRSSTAARRRRWPRSIAWRTVATLSGDRDLSRTPASARRCGRLPARWCEASAPRSSTSRPAASTRTPRRTSDQRRRTST